MIRAMTLRRQFAAAQRDRTPQRFWGTFRQALMEGQIQPEEFSVRDLFEEFVPDGRELVREFDPRMQGNGINLLLLEAAGAVDTTAFSNITGQIVYSTVLQTFNDPIYLGSQLCRNVPTQFDGEKIPGVTQIGDAAEDIGEGQVYPTAGVGEEWIETPRTTKKGFIVPVTKEAVFFDRTGLVLTRSRDVSKWLAVNKDKRILDMALGITTSYRRNGRAAVATYGDNSGDHDWDNLAATNALVDWTDIETAELLFDGITDPNTGEPVAIIPSTIVVPSALRNTAKRIVSATEIEHVDNQANAVTIRTKSSSPVANYTILSSPLVKSRTGSASTWFIGDFMQAFAYMENWPIAVVQAPANSEAEFMQDIVARFKVSERGTPAVIEPRFVVKCTA